MIQPFQVVPSNAPRLGNEDNVYEASRILQEHSGNRQVHELVLSGDEDSKLSSSVVDENVGSDVHFQQPRQYGQFYSGLPFFPHVQRLRHARGGYRYAKPGYEARLLAEGERIYEALCQTEGYVKYRDNQRKSNKKSLKWPTHVDKALCHALVRYPPMGRHQEMLNGKRSGRNQWIAHYLLQLTGETRKQKQISSHTQVLKPWVEHIPDVVRWFPKKDDPASKGKNRVCRTSGRRTSRYPVSAPPHDLYTSSSSVARSDLQRLRDLKRELGVFQPMDFQMFVQRNYKTDEGDEQVQRLHTYTTSIQYPLGADLLVDELDGEQHEFPLLAAMHSRNPLDCTVLDAEASLAFPTEPWKDADGNPLSGVELGIYFLCVSTHLPPTPATTVPCAAPDRGIQIKVHNTFFENGARVKEHSGPLEARVEPSDREPGSTDIRIKFGSTFWAKTLGRLACRLLDQTEDHSAEVANYLQGINVVQEIVAVSDHGAERLLVIHWKFRYSTAVQGRTTWRRILLPSTEPQQPPALLRSGLADAFAQLSTHANEFELSQSQPDPPALQSPFEYESSSGSALSTGTWTGSFDTTHNIERLDGAVDLCNNDNNGFDFSGGTIDLAYGIPMSFDNLDSTTFEFNAAAAAVAAGNCADFASDAALQDFPQQWYESYPDMFAAAAENVTGSLGADAVMETQHASVFDAYGDHQYDHPAYLVGSEPEQAFAGAGSAATQQQEAMVVLKDGDALATLADASFMASALQGTAEEL